MSGYGGGAQRRGGGNGGSGRGPGGPPPVPPKGQAAQNGPVQALRAMLAAKEKRLAAMFPQGGLAVARRVCAMAIVHFERMLLEGQEPDLETVVAAVMRAAQYGLEIIGDQTYLYSYGKKAELVIGPGGLITLASRAGLVAWSRVVFEGDDFDYQLGTDMHSPSGWVKHQKGNERRPENRKDTEARVTHAYAIILPKTIKQGEVAIPIIEVLTAEDIAYYRGFSKAQKGPWFDNFEGMARKTALKRVLKFAPVDMMLTWALDENPDTGGALPFIDTVGEDMDEEKGATHAALTEGRQSAREQLGLDDQARDGEPAPQRQQAQQQRAQRAPDPESDGRDDGPPDGPPPQQGAFGEWAKGQR